MKSIVKKAELMEVNGRDVTSDARFHANLLADYTIKKAADPKRRNKWVTLLEAAQTIYHSGSVSCQEKIRVRLSKLADEFKARNLILVVEPTSKAFKVYEGAEIEKHYVQTKQGYWEARARKAGDWSDYLADDSETIKSEGGIT